MNRRDSLLVPRRPSRPGPLRAEEPSDEAKPGRIWVIDTPEGRRTQLAVLRRAGSPAALSVRAIDCDGELTGSVLVVDRAALVALGEAVAITLAQAEAEGSR